MNGLNLIKDGNTAVCTVTDLSEELKEYIRSDLTSICYGSEEVRDGGDFFSYAQTIKEFLAIYNPKTREIKLGIMGELLAHVVLNIHYPSLTNVGVMLNKEEYSIRKGFDLLHIDRNDTSIWYGEAKAGHKSETDTPTQKARSLAQTAKRDLKDKLTGSRQKLWEIARIDTRLTLFEPRAKTVRDLLINDFVELSSGTAKKNVILVSILFHDSLNPVDKDGVKVCYELIKNEDTFDQVLILSIQKSTLQALEEFFNEESAG